MYLLLKIICLLGFCTCFIGFAKLLLAIILNINIFEPLKDNDIFNKIIYMLFATAMLFISCVFFIALIK